MQKIVLSPRNLLLTALGCVRDIGMIVPIIPMLSREGVQYYLRLQAFLFSPFRIPCCIFPRVDLYHTYEEVPQRRYGSNQPFVILSSAGRILFSIKFGFLPLQKASASPMSRICGLSINDVVRATVAGLSKIALTTSSYTGMVYTAVSF